MQDRICVNSRTGLGNVIPHTGPTSSFANYFHLTYYANMYNTEMSHKRTVSQTITTITSLNQGNVWRSTNHKTFNRTRIIDKTMTYREVREWPFDIYGEGGAEDYPRSKLFSGIPEKQFVFKRAILCRVFYE